MNDFEMNDIEFKELYYFWVMEAVENGKTVFMLDKYNANTCRVNDMSLSRIYEIFSFINRAKGTKSENRYMFWTKEINNE